MKRIFKGSKLYKYNLINEDTEEKNIEGIQKQKKLIKQYLINNNIPQQYEKRVHLLNDTLLGRKCFNTFYYEGFYIDGYKIKYDYSKVYCCYSEFPIEASIENMEYNTIYPEHGIGERYISSKLKDIYFLLKDKFDIVPKITNITEYDFKEDTDHLGRRYMKKLMDTKRTYKIIEYLEISKNKININDTLELIDNIQNNLEDFITEFREETKEKINIDDDLELIDNIESNIENL